MVFVCVIAKAEEVECGDLGNYSDMKKTKENVFNHRDPIILYSSLNALPSAWDPPVNKVLRPFPHS